MDQMASQRRTTMSEESAAKIPKLPTSSLVASSFILGFGILLLLLGVLVLGSQFSSTPLSGAKQSDFMADAFFMPLLLFFFPLVLIAFGTHRLKTHFELNTLGVVGITAVATLLATLAVTMQEYNHFVRLDEDAKQAFN